MKSKKFVILSLVLLCLQGVCLAQTVKVIPAAPNATKMTEFYAQQPNMYTGTANVSIPLYTIDFDGWDLPLSLSYNATGIRTAEEASEVGLGWSLNATGIISRAVRGGDDLFPGTFGTDTKAVGYVHHTKAVTTNFGYDRLILNNPSPTPPTDSYYSYVYYKEPDTQPDIFNYNFFGYSGSFVFTQKISTNGDIRVIKLTEDATKIQFNDTTETFTIVTPTGFKGEFTVKERSTSTVGKREATSRQRACDVDMIDLIELGKSDRYRSVTSWYLTKITSPRGKEIVFSYYLNLDGSSNYLSNERGFAEDDGVGQLPQCLQTIHELIYLKQIVMTNILRLTF